MPFYIKKNKLLSNKTIKKNRTIDKNIISNHINTSTSNRLFGKKSDTDQKIYLSYTIADAFNGPGTFIRNPSCWLNGIKNISCFSPAQYSGYDWYKTAGTLVTKKHVLFAKHLAPSVISGGTPIIFIDDNSNTVRRNLVNVINDTSNPDLDIAIGLLDYEVDSSISIAKILPSNFENYFNISTNIYNVNSNMFNPGLYAIALDQTEKAYMKIFFNFGFASHSGYSSGSATYYSAFLYNVSEISDVFLKSVNPDPKTFINFNKVMVYGDSGNPIFLLIDNELVVLTTWFTPQLGPSILYYKDITNNLINTLSPGQGYSLTSIDLDAVYNKYKID